MWRAHFPLKRSAMHIERRPLQNTVKVALLLFNGPLANTAFVLLLLHGC